MLVLLVAVLAGALSVLTPCVLPLLPAMLASSANGGRRRALGIVAGLVASFTVALVAFSAVVRALGVPSGSLRWTSAAVLLAFGLVLLVAPLRHRFERAAQLVVRLAPAGRGTGDGFWAGALAGGGLGLAWAPCVGPIVAGVAVASATATTGVGEVARAVAFGLGMAVPLLAIVVGGQRAGAALRSRVDPRRVQVVAGVVLVATAVFIGGGYEARANSWLAERTGVSSTLSAGLEQRVLRDRDAGNGTAAAASSPTPASGTLDDLGPAPQVERATQWLNTPGERPLTVSGLQGKVVLVDFWTYSCINCLRTLPHLKRWHREYADDGLVVLGVHAPEFEFEQDEGNVRDAVRDLGIEYPVAMDNDFVTWRNFRNQYWPAKFLVDREGRLRYVHVGEGDYDETERAIRELLGVRDRADVGAPVVDDGENLARSRETYLGFERAANFVGQPAGGALGELARGRVATYAPPRHAGADDAGLGLDEWYLSGRWEVDGERAVARGPGASGGEIVFRYRAADVFLVLGPERRGGRGGTVQVTDTGAPGGGTRAVRVTGQRLYTLRDSDVQADGVVRLQVPAGVAAYAFTFG